MCFYEAHDVGQGVVRRTDEVFSGGVIVGHRPHHLRGCPVRVDFLSDLDEIPVVPIQVGFSDCQ